MVSGNQAKKKSWHERKGKQSQFPAIICSWTATNKTQHIYINIQYIWCQGTRPRTNPGTRERGNNPNFMLSYVAGQQQTKYSICLLSIG